MLVNSVIDLIGNTPLVKINNIDTFGNEIYIKLEGSNPGRSTKDRIALKMIEEAEKEGLIDKDTVIIEATSGNTGIGLAMICAIKNYKLKIVMPNTMSVERIQLMRAYGTEVILTDGSLGMKACLDKLEELKKQEKKYFIPNQFTNPNNPKAHYENTAEEILRDMDNKVDVYICGTGTGGSFSGTAKKLKEKVPNIKTFPVEPASSPLLSKGYIGPHKIQGMGMSIGGIPVVYDGSLADGILVCDDEDAFKMMRELSFKEGILAGISSGATFKAAEQRYGVNALYLVAHSALESAWGRSQIARDKNNFFGIAAYDTTPYTSATKFDNVDSGILGAARWINSRYLHNSGYPANGAYLGNKAGGMNVNYATAPYWGESIASIMFSANEKLGRKDR